MNGCCTSCAGTGTSGDPETSGRCWDCRGTGHAHEPGPCTPRETIQEALRDYVGDADGLDVLVLASHDAEVIAQFCEWLAADKTGGWAIGTYLLDIAKMKRGQMTQEEIDRKWVGK